MGHAHEQRIIHGMFNPGSVLLTNQLESTIADVGFRRLIGPTFGGRRLSTAPETIGSGELLFSSDVYAFKVTIHMTVTGSRAAHRP
jgi:serine/threonine protein kinase